MVLDSAPQELFEILRKLPPGEEPAPQKSGDAPRAHSGEEKSKTTIGLEAPAAARTPLSAAKTAPARESAPVSASMFLFPRLSHLRPAATGRGKTVALRLDLAAAILAGLAVLFVLAYLLGREVGRRDAGSRAPSGRSAAPLLERSPGALELGARETARIRTESPVLARARYTLEVWRYQPNNESAAQQLRQWLEERGYRPAMLVRKGPELSVCVGQFELKTDPRLSTLKQELSNLNYGSSKRFASSCHITELP